MASESQKHTQTYPRTHCLLSTRPSPHPLLPAANLLLSGHDIAVEPVHLAAELVDAGDSALADGLAAHRVASVQGVVLALLCGESALIRLRLWVLEVGDLLEHKLAPAQCRCHTWEGTCDGRRKGGHEDGKPEEDGEAQCKTLREVHDFMDRIVGG